MPDASERFVALAAKSLEGNAESYLAVKGDLHRRLTNNPAATPDAIAVAADALETADRHPLRRWWRPALYLIALLVSLPMFARPIQQFRQFAAINDLISLSPVPEPSKFDYTKNLTPSQKLLLQGNDQATTDAERWKPLWDSDPENPAYFLEYATAYFRDHKSLSPEILSTAERLDPDNGWYLAAHAAAKAASTINKKSPNYAARKRGEKATFTVTDEAGFAEALDLLHQAARKPKLIGTDPEILQQRIAMLPERTDFVSQLPRLAQAAGQPANTIHLRSIADAIRIQAERCGKNGDVEGFQQLVKDWKNLTHNFVRDGSSMVDLLVAKVVLAGPLPDFHDAAEALGLEEQAAYFDTLHTQFEALRERNRATQRDDSESHLILTKGSLLARLSLPMISRQVKSPPEISDTDLRPARYADHALFARAHTIASWMLFAMFAALAILGQRRGGGLAGQLSKRFQETLRLTDWAWILLGGIGLPLLWAIAITRFTPFSAREWSVGTEDFRLLGAQLCSVTLLIMVSSTVIVSQRLKKRVGFLGLKPQLPRLGWAAIICSALAIPIIGTLKVLPSQLGHLTFWTGCVLSGFGLLWLIWGFFCHALGKPAAGVLRRTTLSGIMIPTWAFGALVFSLVIPAHYAEERYWIQQDRLLEITPEAPAMSRYEFDVTQTLRKELMEVIQSIPEGEA